MFCPNCGTNNPDGSKFCSECGTVFESVKSPEAADTPTPTVDEILGEIKSEPAAQPAPVESEPSAPVELAKPAPAEPAQPVPEPAQPIAEQPMPVPVPEQPAPVPVPEQPASVPVPEQPAPAPQAVAPVQPAPAPQVVAPVQPAPAPQAAAPVQPAPQQIPQQQMPQYQQPAYAQPAAPVAPKPPKPPRKPLDAKQKKLLIIGGSCAAVLVAFLIVLFAAIIPHSGLKGKLRYSWTRVDRSSTNVLNLKKKTWIVGSKTYKIKSWKTSGDRVQINYTEDNLNLESETFVVAFSPDGKKVYFFDAYGYNDGDRPDYVFARGSAVQSTNVLDTLPW